MNAKQGFSLAARVGSFRHAFRGVGSVLASQHNAWIHLLATVGVCGAGLVFAISRLEWCAVVIAIVLVWMAEALNTAFELLCDVASPEFHPLVQKGKDVAAGAVLLSAVGAAVIGLLVFVPYLLRMVG
jgi:diacylglycerol kinase (ATP)